MKVLKLNNLLILAGILSWVACQQQTDPAEKVVVNQNGDIVLFGAETDLENLRANLFDTLMKMPDVPDSIDIKYDGEVLMGMRGEVETEIRDVIANAKASKLKPVVESRRFWKEEGTDCDKPDTLRFNCGVIHMEYPVVYYKENNLQKSVDAWTSKYLRGILTSEVGEDHISAPTLEEAAKIFFKGREDFRESVMYGAFEAKTNYELLLNDGKHLTLEIHGYSFQGGAHGSPTAAVTTFDVKTGKRLTWEDFVNDKAALAVLAENKFRVERTDAFEEGFDFDDIFPFKLPDNYGLTKEGIYFHYLHYEVGPYSMGSTTFTIPFSEIGKLSKVPS